MKLAARLLGLMVRHRACEVALPLSADIALIFGWFFPTRIFAGPVMPSRRYVYR